MALMFVAAQWFRFVAVFDLPATMLSRLFQQHLSTLTDALSDDSIP